MLRPHGFTGRRLDAIPVTDLNRRVIKPPPPINPATTTAWRLSARCLRVVALALAGLGGLESAAGAQPVAPAPAPSASAPANEGIATAQTLFVEGRAAMERGDFPAARARFTSSLAIVTRASTLLNLAQCETHEGELVNAALHTKQGIDLLPIGDERLVLAKDRAAALARRLAHLTLKLTAAAPAGAHVKVDGVEAQVAALLGGLPVNPGRHVVIFLVPGQGDQRVTVDLVEGDARTVTLTVDETVRGPAQAPVVDRPKAGHHEASSKRTVGFILGGIGLAGLVGAGVTGGLLVSKHAAITDACPMKRCSPEGRDLIATTRPLNIVNGVAWGVGLASLAGGVVLVVLGRGDGEATAIAPAALAGGGGLQITQTF
jgi:hypothetical protein